MSFPSWNCSKWASWLEWKLYNCKKNKLPNDDFNAHVWGAKQEANTPVHQWLVVAYAPWYPKDAKGRSQGWDTGWALQCFAEFGKCLIPLNTHSFPYLQLPLRTNLFSELSRARSHLALGFLACLGYCPLQTISAHQTSPGKAGARVPGSCIFLT